jgi:hypothetical protein
MNISKHSNNDRKRASVMNVSSTTSLPAFVVEDKKRSLCHRLSNSMSCLRPRKKISRKASVRNSMSHVVPKKLVSISQFDKRKQWWDTLIIFLVLYTVIVVPLEIGFDTRDDTKGVGYNFHYLAIEIIDHCCDALFFLDIVLTFSTSIVDKMGNEIFDTKLVAKRYMYSWFIVDLLSCVPLDTFINPSNNDPQSSLSGGLSVLKFLKIPRLLRVIRIFKKLEQLAVAAFFRFIRLVFVLLMLTHLVACIFGVLVERDDSFWLLSQPQEMVSQWETRWVLCFNYVSKTFYGGSIEGTTSIELMVEPIILFIGAGMQAAIVGSVTMIITTANSREQEYTNTMDLVNASMRMLNTEESLQEEIRGYFDFLYQVYGSSTGRQDAWVDLLSPGLSARFLLSKYNDILSRVPIFQDASVGFIETLLKRLSTQMYVPYELVCRRGERGSHMYFVLQGVAQAFLITDEGEKKVLAKMKRGNCKGHCLLPPYLPLPH